MEINKSSDIRSENESGSSDEEVKEVTTRLEGVMSDSTEVNPRKYSLATLRNVKSADNEDDRVASFQAKIVEVIEIIKY
jgi:hypothetical protein